MPQLPWIRFEVNLPRNPKILALLKEPDGYAAAWLYVCMLAYSGEHGTDGWIPAEALLTFGGNFADSPPVTRSVTQSAVKRHLCYGERYADLLVIHRLCDAVSGGWSIHDWDHYQAISDEARARRERAQAAAAARWNGHTARSGAERQAAYRARKKDW